MGGRTDICKHLMHRQAAEESFTVRSFWSQGLFLLDFKRSSPQTECLCLGSFAEAQSELLLCWVWLRESHPLTSCLLRTRCRSVTCQEVDLAPYRRRCCRGCARLEHTECKAAKASCCFYMRSVYPEVTQAFTLLYTLIEDMLMQLIV